MKAILLSLTLILSAHLSHAQYSMGIHAGPNKAFYRPFEATPGMKDSGSVTTFPTLVSSAYILSAKDWPVNLGLGIGIRQNDIKIYRELQGYNKVMNVLDLRHKSTYLSISPMVDARLGRKDFLHLLVGPNINVLVTGKENGYNTYSTGGSEFYQNSAENIKGISLGLQGQLQGRLPITKTIEMTGAIGYSINNAISSRLPGESGNASFQVGIIYKKPTSTVKGKDKHDTQNTTVEEQ